jgi:SulP family sulfate permease
MVASGQDATTVDREPIMTSMQREGTWRGDLAGGSTATILALPEAIAFGALTFGVLGPAMVPAGIAACLLTLVICNLAAGPIGGVRIMHLGNYSLAAVMMASTLTFIATGMGLEGELTPEEAAPVLTVLFLTVLLAGAFQVVFGLLRLGVLTKYIPHPVLAGLFNGTAILMLVSQLAPMLGCRRRRP